MVGFPDKCIIAKQNLKNHLLAWRFTSIVAVFFFLGWVLVDFDNDYLLIAGSFILIFTFPAIYLHLEYSINAAGKTIEINSEKIVVHRRHSVNEFAASEIKSITMYKSASLDRNGVPLSQMEYYHFARIITSSGVAIIVNSLMYSKIDQLTYLFREARYTRKTGFFCSVFLK